MSEVQAGVVPLGIGIVGAGDVAARDYLPEIHRLHERGRVVAIASRDGQRARALAERYGIAAAHAGHEALLADPAVDVVANLTQLADHVEVTRAAIRSGRHVYTEKPAAATYAEVRALIALAAAHDVAVAAAPSVMAFPQVARLAQLVSAGAIGPVWTAIGQFLGGVPPWAGYESDPSGFFARGAGPLVDVGIYPLHALTGVLGPVTRVSASSHRSRDRFVQIDGSAAGRTIPVEVDDVWHVHLSFVSGAVASVRADFAAAGASRAADVEFNGERGTIAAQLIDMTAPLLVSDEAAPDGWRAEAFPGARAAGPDHVLGIDHLLRHVVDGAPLRLTLDHAAHVVEVLEACARSASEHRAIDVLSRFATPATTEA